MRIVGRGLEEDLICDPGNELRKGRGLEKMRISQPI